MENMFGDVIYRYGREQAINDGVIIDVSEAAREAGFILPVALTSAVWEKINDVPKSFVGIQDVNGRLWDVLCMAAMKAKSVTGDSFKYNLIMHNGRKKYIELKSVISAGDNLEPVLTIMLPNED